MIAHTCQPLTVRSADQLAVLDNGRVVELGKHQEIINQAVLFARLVEQQRQSLISLPHMKVMVQYPLSETFSHLTSVNDYIKAQLRSPAESGWTEPRLLFSTSSTHLQDSASHYQTSLRTTSKNMLGSAVLQAYHWQLIVSAIGSYLIDRRVPDLSLHNAQAKLDEERRLEVESVAFVSSCFYALPTDPAAAHPDASIVPNIATLQDQLRQELETHLGWVIEQLGQTLGAKPRGLWLDVTDRCAATLIWLMQEIDPDTDPAAIEQEIEQLLLVPASPLNHPKLGLFTLTCGAETRAFLDKSSCCYWYRMDEAEGKLCTTCPRRPKDERNQLLLKYMAEAQAKKAQEIAEQAPVSEA